MRAGSPSFWIKVALVVAVVAAADALLFDIDALGVNVGLFSLSFVIALGIASPAIRRNRLSVAALAAAAAFAVMQIERPTFLGWLLFGAALAVGALAPRAAKGEDGWRWTQRLVFAGMLGAFGPLLDLMRVLKVRRASRPMKLRLRLAGLVLPIVGGGVFVALFAAANPVIEQAFAAVHLAEPDVGRAIFWLMVATLLWAVLRPRSLRRTVGGPGLDRELTAPGVTTASIAGSLAVFNLIFAVQNGLDIAFLWSGAGLPDGVSFADYAHRGAYPLIATALLAGLFVVVFLRPGSETASSRPVRVLVTIWVAQNLFLVASTALRTLDYVEAYSLTRVRIAALLWMGLVAVGLVLITWRLLRGRSSSWLINANLVAAGSVLVLCSVIDLGAVAAHWNVRHAREAGGRGVDLDLCYMRKLKGAAVVSLAELELRPIPRELRERVGRVRRDLTADMVRRGSDWRGWRWRDERRLQRLRSLLGPAADAPSDRRADCQGRLPPPPPVAIATPAPLTPTPNPGN